MDIKTFISQTMNGEAGAAKDTLNDLLSAKAFEALDAKKQEIGSTLFGGQTQTTEEPATEEPTE